MFSSLKDNMMLAKESLKTKLFTGTRTPLANALISHLKLRNVERIIAGKPNTLVIVTDKLVVRVPLDKLSATRCRINNMMLKKLSKTGIANFVPVALSEGRLSGQSYYCESRLPGVAIDLPISRMNELVTKAADFITKFHQETARDIFIDEVSFKRLFGRDFDRLYPYLNDEYQVKLLKIKERVKREVMGKKLRTVWFHGDYKVENVLFDSATWQIKGVIDWDLSRQEGLPLLDIFYLLAYKDSSLVSKKRVTDVMKDRFMKENFNKIEKDVMDQYVRVNRVKSDFVKSLIIMFLLNHLCQRYGQQLISNKFDWAYKNIYDGIDMILNCIEEIQ